MQSRKVPSIPLLSKAGRTLQPVNRESPESASTSSTLAATEESAGHSRRQSQSPPGNDVSAAPKASAMVNAHSLLPSLSLVSPRTGGVGALRISPRRKSKLLMEGDVESEAEKHLMSELQGTEWGSLRTGIEAAFDKINRITEGIQKDIEEDELTLHKMTTLRLTELGYEGGLCAGPSDSIMSPRATDLRQRCHSNIDPDIAPQSTIRRVLSQPVLDIPVEQEQHKWQLDAATAPSSPRGFREAFGPPSIHEEPSQRSAVEGPPTTSVPNGGTDPNDLTDLVAAAAEALEQFNQSEEAAVSKAINHNRNRMTSQTRPNLRSVSPAPKGSFEPPTAAMDQPNAMDLLNLDQVQHLLAPMLETIDSGGLRREVVRLNHEMGLGRIRLAMRVQQLEWERERRRLRDTENATLRKALADVSSQKEYLEKRLCEYEGESCQFGRLLFGPVFCCAQKRPGRSRTMDRTNTNADRKGAPTRIPSKRTATTTSCASTASSSASTATSMNNL